MILGSLIDAGVPFSDIASVVGSLGLDGVRVTHRRVDRAGIGATKFDVVDGGPAQAQRAATDGEDTSGSAPLSAAGPHDHNGEHDHRDHHHDRHDHDDHGDHPPSHGHHRSGDPANARRGHHHRGLSDIVSLIERADLSSAACERAVSLFRRLAEVEAQIHQMPVEDVHLHEVGAVDSIVDIVGAVRALELIGVDRVVASPLNVGSGTVFCAHGELPVPAPATAKLLVDVPIYAAGPAVELLTPTGALLLSAYAETYGPVPAMRLARIGYGAGDRDLAGRPNVVRALVGDTEDVANLERVVRLECEIDDMNPELYGVLMDRLTAAGALDVFYTPIQMKKNRPGTLVTVIAQPSSRDTLTNVLFQESTTIGVRVTETERERLDREVIMVDSLVGPVRVKVARRHGAVVNAAPEFEDCARIAVECGRPVKQVQAFAMKAWLEVASRDSSS